MCLSFHYFMIILGIDPGSRITGYGLVQKTGTKITHVDNGIIDVTKAVTFEKKLQKIFESIRQIISTFNPAEVAIENIFYAKNVQSALKLGHARGSALIAFSVENKPVFEYTALQVKQAVTGFGKAEKTQVQKMTKTLLNLPQVAEENAADALAVALCHAHTGNLRKIIQVK